MSAPIVLYVGPSALDGAPIVALATVGSKNVKTGSMVQTWIMRSDMDPVAASKLALDASVCGQCPRRHSLAGDCYVTIFQAPLSAWKAWDRAGRPGENWADHREVLALQRDACATGLRLGSYGDPAAVPHAVWSDVIEALQPRSVVGYTHQWRGMEAAAMYPTTDFDRAQWFRDHVMASSDSVQDALHARSLGWRYFLAVGAEVPASALPARTVTCPATISDRTCATCGACDGAARGAGKASISLTEHGARSSSKARRAASLTVVR